LFLLQKNKGNLFEKIRQAQNLKNKIDKYLKRFLDFSGLLVSVCSEVDYLQNYFTK